MMSVSGVRRTVSEIRLRPVSLLVIAGFALSACQTMQLRQNSLFGGKESPGVAGGLGAKSSLRGIREAAQRWEKDPSSVSLAISYAKRLQAIGSHEHALSVLQQTRSGNPRDKDIAIAYGRQLAEMNRLAEASKVLKQARGLGKPDWRLSSLHGTVLDRMGHHKNARKLYQYALKLNPGKASILNNLGMSYALGGDLKKAEKTLKTALAKAPGNTRIRQNLALVTGLQGRFSDAGKIASADLPPNLVASNMRYLRSMLSQSNTWDLIKKQGGKKK